MMMMIVQCGCVMVDDRSSARIEAMLHVFMTVYTSAIVSIDLTICSWRLLR